MKSTIGFALVGCGYWGPNFIRNIGATTEGRVVLCCDKDPRRLETVRALYPGMKTTISFEEVLGNPDVDAVVLATPVSTHYDLAKRILASGRHVLIEKPIARSSAEARELVDLAASRNLTLMVGHTFEYSPPVNKARDLLHEGRLGKVHYIDTIRVNLGLFQSDVSVVWDLAPHDVSIILYLLGRDPVAVWGVGSHYVQKDIEDVAFAVLEFADRTLAHIHVSWLAPAKVRRMTVVGSDRMLVYDDTENLEKIKVFNAGVDRPSEEEFFGNFQLIYRTGDIYSPMVSTVEPLKIECQHLVEAIRTSTRPRSDGVVGLRVVRVLEAIEQSIRQRGQIVRLG